MENCFRCGQEEDEVRLFDGISVTDPVKVCEKCALLEGMPIVKVPSVDQLKSSERKDYVYKRLRRMTGGGEASPKKSIFEELRDAEERGKISKISTKPLNLVKNYHWIIQHERRHKGLSQKQLADLIGESEMAIKMIERDSLPEEALSVIKKLQQFFRVRLIKDEEHLNYLKPSEPKIVYNSAQKVSQLREEEMKYLEEDEMVKQAIRTEHQPGIIRREKFEGEPLRVLDFKKEKLNKVTIADLREINKVIERDYPTKTREQVGKEQLEDFGKSDSSPGKEFHLSSWSKDYLVKRQKMIERTKPGIKSCLVPSIAELAEKKKIAPKEVPEDGPEKSIVGDEIEIEEPSKRDEIEFL